ncbi:isocitrate lyase [Candidatus Parcubacteria bacterium]|nr:MAG: isocitrate lyase [Candidatus Parcubacteria bacterium]
MTRFDGVLRPYSTDQVRKLQGSLLENHSYANLVAEKLWKKLNEENYVHALGAVTGNQAMQMVRAGLSAIYCSGWQVAADNNDSLQMYPDQSLYAVNSVPMLVRRINNCLRRADQIEWMENNVTKDWFVPIVADAEAGFGGPLNVFELMKSMIEAGAAGVHFEDQLASAKKCGHMGGKVLIPTSQFIKTLVAARLAADVCNTSTIIIARTDADSAKLLTSDIDPIDRPFIKRKDTSLEGNFGDTLIRSEICRTEEGFYEITGGLDMAIARGLAYAPYADLIWCETSTPSIEGAKKFADAIHEKFPGKLLAYNCSPSFNWKKYLSNSEMYEFQMKLGELGYKFQFITLAGFHSLNYSMFELSRKYKYLGMTAYSELQSDEFLSERSNGYTAVKHQREVGTGYFDAVMETIGSSLTALGESTETAQF